MLMFSLVGALVAINLDEIPIYRIPDDLENMGDGTHCARGTLEKAWTEESGASAELVPNRACKYSIRHWRRDRNDIAMCSHAENRPVLTLALLYYKDGVFFKDQLSRWRSLPLHIRQQISFLVVDDGSPHGEKAIDIYTDDGSINIIFTTILADKDWNIGGARNLAFHIAQTEHVFVIDSDLLVPLELLELSLKYTKEELAINFNESSKKRSVFINFDRMFNNSGLHRPHPAAMLLSKTAYWVCGGCDEDFVGHYGMTDPHFRWRSVKTGKVIVKDVLGVSSNPLVMMEAKSKLSIPRDATTNIRLFREKVVGNLPWSNKYLRFPWKLESVFCLGRARDK